MSSSIKVGVRVRPIASTESREGILFESFDNTSLVFQGQTFTYDHVFDTELTQRDLYNETAAPMLKDFLEGYNVTIIASGKQDLVKHLLWEHLILSRGLTTSKV
jgi:kinesin family protein 4/21/27